MRSGARALLVLLALPGPATLAAERDERAGGPEERYTLSAAHQGGRFVAWRLDRQDGRVSACLRGNRDEILCSAWSVAATPAVQGPFAINAESSVPVGTLWVWRIDSQSGRLDYCSVSCCQNLETTRPACAPSQD